MEILLSIMAFVFGACMGSFLCCQVRRLHLKESPSKAPKPAKTIKATKTKSKSSLGPRSVCLSCKHQLKWYENIPIVSWLALKGKCKHCGSKIGLAEFLSELGTGLAFLAVFTTFCYSACHPNNSTLFGAFQTQNLATGLSSIGALNYAILAIFALLILTLIFLAIYDGLYGELPSLCLTISILFALTIAALRIWSILQVAPFSANLIIDPLFSVLILGGLYLVLYLVSKGRWVGDGDWLLGLAIGLALANPFLALIVLFLSNALACIVAYPSVKGNRQKKIYFGPFMVVAFVIAVAIAAHLAEWGLSF